MGIFKYKIKQKLRDSSGEVMIESTLVMLVTIFVLVAMISMGFLFYQQCMLQTVANEIATDIGTNYKLTGQSIGQVDVSQTSLKDIKLYRTSFSMFSMKELHKQRAKEYLSDRIRLTTLGIMSKEPTVDSFDIKVDNIGRLHVEVTISMECEILFGGALEYFQIINSKPKFTAVGSAECLDITAYASHVQFVSYLGNKIETNGGTSNEIIAKIYKITQDSKSIMSSIFGE